MQMFETLKKVRNFPSTNLTAFVTLLLIGGIAYFNVIKGPFFFDDEQFIVKNEFVHHFDVLKIYTTSVTQGANIQSNFYRPNQQFIFSILYNVFGPNAMAFHINSILFHILNTFLIFQLFLLLGLDRKISFAGSILFLIHPVQTESVSYISGFADVLGLFFLLGGLLLFIHAVLEVPVNRRKNSILSGWPLLILSLLLFILALFSKESMVILFPLVGLVMIYFRTMEQLKFNRFNLIGSGLTGFIVILYLILKFSAFNFSDTLGLTKTHSVYTDSLIVRLFTFIHILPEYMKLYLFPLNLYYGKPYMAFTDLFSINAGEASIGLLLLFTTAFAIYKFKKYPNLAIGSGWFLFSLIPFSGIIPLNAMYLEHWIYVPSIGLIFLTLIVFQYTSKFNIQGIVNIAFISVSVLFLKRDYSRNEEWAFAEKFYLNEIKYNKNVSNFNNLGMYYAEKKNYPKALQYYGLSVQVYDAFPQPHYNMANIYLDQNDLNSAVNEIYLALHIDPEFYQALSTLRKIYEFTNQPEKANTVGNLIARLDQGGKITVAEIDAVRP